MIGGDTASATGWRRALVWLGGGALLLQMSVDAIAVIGRHVGVPLHGSIEIIQATLLVSGTLGMLIATLAGVHARVHLLVDRLPVAWRAPLHHASLLCAGLFFVALCVGSAWIASDLWHAQEESELLRIPYAPLRILAVLIAVSVAVVFLRQAFGRKPS